MNTRVQLQGEWVESPVGVAPTAMQRMAHHDGELATARGEDVQVPILRLFICFQPVAILFVCMSVCLFLACSNTVCMYVCSSVSSL